MIYLDTHIAADLWDGRSDRMNREAQRVVGSTSDLRLSPMVVLELELLHEIGRVRPNANEVVADLSKDLGVRICDVSFADVARAALAEGWTRDPFDRMIVAHARMQKARLITRDERMHRQYRLALG